MQALHPQKCTVFLQSKHSFILCTALSLTAARAVVAKQRISYTTNKLHLKLLWTSSMKPNAITAGGRSPSPTIWTLPRCVPGTPGAGSATSPHENSIRAQRINSHINLLCKINLQTYLNLFWDQFFWAVFIYMRSKLWPDISGLSSQRYLINLWLRLQATFVLNEVIYNFRSRWANIACTWFVDRKGCRRWWW